jgi:uncharacterized protein YdeI (YjbR/CyaY-like superfamily)
VPDDSKNIDAYIAKAAPFAKPILEKIRRVVHRADPDIEERIKWGVPSFEKKGPVCGVAAFKKHAAFMFWRAAQLDDPAGILKGNRGGTIVDKLTDVSELPSDDVLVDYVRRAIALNLSGAKSPMSRPKGPKKPEAKVPPDLAAALKKDAKAKATFEQFPPGQRREYVAWITEAKQEATREGRLKQAIEWMSEGKPRNWKYMK